MLSPEVQRKTTEREENRNSYDLWQSRGFGRELREGLGFFRVSYLKRMLRLSGVGGEGGIRTLETPHEA
jgi:hypothetical protein